MKSRTLIIAALILLVLCGLFVLAAALRRDMRREFERAMSDWTAIGGRESYLALKPPPVPDEENAATLYRRAFAIFESLEPNERTALGDRQRDSEAHRAVLLKLAPAFELAHEAAAMERVFWSDELYETPFIAVMPWLGNGRWLASALIERARSEAEAGRLDEAARCLHTAIVLANHATIDPTVISLLVQWASHAQVLDALQEIFRGRELPPGLIEPLLREIDTGARLATALEGEALGLLDIIRAGDIQTFVIWGELETSPGFYARAWWYRDLDGAFTLDYFRQAIEAARGPFHERAALAEPASFPASAVISRLMLPGVGRLDLNTAQAETRRLLALAAIDLRAHRREHGTYPPPDDWPMPLDPTTGNPMIYELTEDGFILRADPAGASTLMWEWE